MTTAVGGLTTGSRIHRFCYGNGCERPGRNVPHSVILPGFQTMLPMRNEKTRISFVNDVMLCETFDAVSNLSGAKLKSGREILFNSFVWFDNASLWE